MFLTGKFWENCHSRSFYSSIIILFLVWRFGLFYFWLKIKGGTNALFVYFLYHPITEVLYWSKKIFKEKFHLAALQFISRKDVLRALRHVMLLTQRFHLFWKHAVKTTVKSHLDYIDYKFCWSLIFCLDNTVNEITFMCVDIIKVCKSLIECWIDSLYRQFSLKFQWKTSGSILTLHLLWI